MRSQRLGERVGLESPAVPRSVALSLVALLAACGGAPAAAPAAPAVEVYAAASLREVALELGAAFGRRQGAAPVFNFAGSNTLAQQILAAPRADVFLSADAAWMTALVEAGRVDPATVRPFLGNRLVLVARRGSAVAAGDPWVLAGDGYRHLALADPGAVPAGRYARAYLEALEGEGGSLWRRVEARVVPALDVRAALALVESDPEILGIVYRTDAATSAGVRLLYEFPPRADHPVQYWSAVVRHGPGRSQGRRFVEFLESPEAVEIARRHGFIVAPG